MQIRRKAGFSLVEILIVVVILVVLAAIFMPRYLKPVKSLDGRTTDSPIQRGHAVECFNNLKQIRDAYVIATTSDEEHKPQSLADLKAYGVSDSMTRCPVDGQPYQFDPSTGRVWCTHPGHEQQ